MTLTASDKRWISNQIKKKVNEAVENAFVGIGGYDGATLVVDADMYEHALNKPLPNRIGFHTAGPESTT